MKAIALIIDSYLILSYSGSIADVRWSLWIWSSTKWISKFCFCAVSQIKLSATSPTNPLFSFPRQNPLVDYSCSRTSQCMRLLHYRYKISSTTLHFWQTLLLIHEFKRSLGFVDVDKFTVEYRRCSTEIVHSSLKEFCTRQKVTNIKSSTYRHALRSRFWISFRCEVEVHAWKFNEEIFIIRIKHGPHTSNCTTDSGPPHGKRYSSS